MPAEVADDAHGRAPGIEQAVKRRARELHPAGGAAGADDGVVRAGFEAQEVSAGDAIVAHDGNEGGELAAKDGTKEARALGEGLALDFVAVVAAVAARVEAEGGRRPVSRSSRTASVRSTGNGGRR